MERALPVFLCVLSAGYNLLGFGDHELPLCDENSECAELNESASEGCTWAICVDGRCRRIEDSRDEDDD